jgi:hypothetical protein
MVLTGGSWWQGVRGEREGGVGWLPGLTRLELGPGHGPGWAGHFFSFFLFWFLFFSVSLFSFISLAS